MLKWGISKSKKSKAEKRSSEINNILLVSALGFQASGDRLNNSISLSLFFFFSDSTILALDFQSTEAVFSKRVMNDKSDLKY